MSAAPSPDSAGSEHAEDEATSNEAFVAALLEQHEQVFESLPASDPRRSLGLSRLAKLMRGWYDKTGQESYLEHALSFAARAVSECTQQDELRLDYVLLHVELLHANFDATGSIGAADAYVAGLRTLIELTTDESDKSWFECQLGTLIYSRFEVSELKEDLENAIELLGGLPQLVLDEHPPARIYLGMAKSRFYAYSHSVNDLEDAVKLLHRGLLDFIPNIDFRDESLVEVYRHGMATLGISWERLLYATPSVQLIRQSIMDTKQVLDAAPPQTTTVDLLHVYYIRFLMRQYFRPAESSREIMEVVTLQHIDAEIAEEQAPKLPAQPALLGSHVAFAHEPLPNDSTHLRMVTLLPGGGEETIRCELNTEILHSNRPYEALSYVWGDPSAKLPILINGRPYDITRNLYAALARLRQPTESRTLWIDAICIDQSNNREKSTQVTLMSDIYAKAHHVIMWLGELSAVEPVFGPRDDSVEVLSQSDTEDETSEAGASGESGRYENAMRHTQAAQARQTAAAERWKGHEELMQLMMARLRHEIDWFRPLFFGSKPVSGIPRHADALLSEDYLKKVGDYVQHVAAMERLLMNIRSSRTSGRTAARLDWTSWRNIPDIFALPATRTLWPVHGAMSILFSLARNDHFNQLPFFCEEWEDEIAYYPSAVWQDSASALIDLLNAPYWNRAWILQEIVLAEQPVLHWGPVIISFEDLVQAQLHFKTHYDTCCSRWGKNAHRTVHTYWSNIYRGFTKIKDLADLRKAFKSDHVGAERTLSFRDLIFRGRGRRRATDPRDMIYGLLGLVREEERILPDYTLSVAQVFTKIAYEMLERDKNLGMLMYNDLGHHISFELPSWVPDWTFPGIYHPSYYPTLFDASKKSTYESSMDHSCRLKITTRLVDRIAAISPKMTPQWSPPENMITRVKEWQDLACLGETEDSSARSDELLDSFWRSVFADTMQTRIYEIGVDQKTRITANDLAKIRKWWVWIQQRASEMYASEWGALRTKNHEEEYHVVTDRFWHSTDSRKLFRTVQGRLGTGTAGSDGDRLRDVKVGDEIHIALGSDYPLVLRPDEEGISPDNGRQYEFVSVCYMHGVMDGEAVDDDRLTWETVFLC